MGSPTTFQRDFDYISVVYRFCQQMKIDLGSILKELTDQSSTSGTKSKYCYELELDYLDLEVRTTGSGASKKKAKSEACKQGLIQLVHYLRQSNSALSLENYGLTEEELDEYGEVLADKQANSLNAEANPFLPSTCLNPSVSEFVPSDLIEKAANAAVKSKPNAWNNGKWTLTAASTSANWRDDQKCIFAKAPSANGFQRAAPGASRVENSEQSKIEPSETKIEPSETKIEPSESANGVIEPKIAKAVEQEDASSSTTPKPKSPSELENLDLNQMAAEIRKLKDAMANGLPKLKEKEEESDHRRPSADPNGSNWATVQEAAVYLNENHDAFQELLKLHEEKPAKSYRQLLSKLSELMPKLKYEFRLTGPNELGVSQLLYGEQCVQTVFAAFPPSAACPDLAATLDESCAKKQFYILKLNYLS